MARKRMVTRTLISTELTILCLDVETGEPMNRKFIVTGKFNNDEAALKKAKQTYESTTLKLVHVVNSEQMKLQYKMDENKFIANADEVEEV